jgi:iron complex outermembrane receptor protein
MITHFARKFKVRATAAAGCGGRTLTNSGNLSVITAQHGNASLIGLALPALIATSTIAHASDVTTPAVAVAAPADANGPGDIVVTAEKKETTLQKAPLAITALTADTLTRSNITQLIDMNGFVPGLTVANSGSFVRVVSIRGIGYEASDNLSAEPGTSFHIDGVYIVSPYALQQDFLDLQRVEVLRSAGHCFRPSATGGIVNAITERPDTRAMHGSAQVEYGNYNLRVQLACSTCRSVTPSRSVRRCSIISMTASPSRLAWATSMGSTTPIAPPGKFRLFGRPMTNFRRS